jgi:hypothetical protein
MNNPGVDVETWQGLRKKWAELDAAGHTVKVDFQLLADPQDDKNILAIDVVQHIDEDLITETVQRQAGEAYEPLGIAGLSLERLVEVYKEMLAQMHEQQAAQDATLVVTMSPTSPTAGEVRGYMEQAGVRSSLPVNYQHYYMLAALREKMIETAAEAWSSVQAVYEADNLEFYFGY